MFDIWVLVALGFVGVAAGFVDAVAGGGGLISITALVSAGLPPVAALATNKAQSIVGTSMAAFTFWRKGYIQPGILLPSILTAFAGSWLGATVVRLIDTSILTLAIPVAVIGVALYFAFSPSIRDVDSTPRLRFDLLMPLVAFALGFYDGVFGPGTGSFLMICFVALFGFSAIRASANTKVINLTSNLAALIFFILAGEVVWVVAAVMAAGNFVGGYLGALVGIRFGVKVIRPLVIVVSIVLAGRLLLFP